MSKPKPIFNGFGRDELILLFKFMVNYESIVEQYKKGEYVKIFVKHIPYAQMDVKSQIQMDQYIDSDITHGIYMTGKGSKPLVLLRHLRNSIAHGYIAKDSSKVHIEDWNLKNKVKFLTAKGECSWKEIKSILNIFIK